MAAQVSVSMGALQRLLSRVGGPGERLLRRRAERVRDLAKAYAWTHGSIPEGIIVGPFDPSTRSMPVISTHPATLYVHNGTRPHIIRPRRRGGVLRFRINGRIVYARFVNHPGYRGDDFLTRALRNA